MRRVDLFFGTSCSSRTRHNTCEAIYTHFLENESKAVSVHAFTTVRPKADKHTVMCVLYELGPLSSIEHESSKPYSRTELTERRMFLKSIAAKIVECSKYSSVRIEDNYGHKLYDWKNPAKPSWFTQWFAWWL